MIKHFRNRYFVVFDLIALPLVVYLAFALRVDDLDISPYAPAWLAYSGLALVVIPSVFLLTGIYARYWPYASGEDLLVQALALGGGGIGVCVAGWLGLSMAGMPLPPRSFPFLFLLLALFATSGPRALVRLYSARRSRFAPPEGQTHRHVLIMGAGEAGATVVQELLRHPQLGLEPVGFLDDDPTKRDMLIRGMPVLGDRNEITRLAKTLHVRQVIIAMPRATGKTIREVTQLCEQAGVAVRIMPGMSDLLGGKVSVNQLRKVDIEDLLRRDPIQTDVATVKALLRGKRVLITGGGGSIGSELCRQVLQCDPAQLVLVGHGENSVFEIENELKHYLKLNSGNYPPRTAPQPEIVGVVASVRMPERLKAIFDRYRPQVVFHAAAHKHVPLMELQPSEAIMNNIIGTRNLLAACQKHDVEQFVMISTDKAVNPTSIMGASKRIAELLVLQTARVSHKPYVAVRFGNVLGSRGSVVLTFRRQIAEGGPVTVTHPEMRRFFMTIPEAVQLVLQAAVIGKGGEIFMLDMGEPVKLVDLAKDMIRLSGLELGHDIEIAYTGMRPGEKMYEELFIKGEDYQRTPNEKVYIASNASSFVPDKLNEMIEELEGAAIRDDEVAMRAMFHRIIAEYQPPSAPSTPLPAGDTIQEARQQERPANSAMQELRPLHGSAGSH